MHIFNFISESAVYNTLGHLKNCWNYTYPTGKALEEAIYRGLRPYYQNVRILGGPNTIVDVANDNDAYDIKGAKQLGFLTKLSSSSNQLENNFVKVDLDNNEKIIVKIPKKILAIIKRPNTDMQKYQGDPEKVLNESLQEYQTFAVKTTEASGCENLYSIVVLYDEDKDKGIRSIFFTVEEFSLPNIINGDYIKNKNKTKNFGYAGIDNSNSICYKLVEFNKGSVNSYKEYKCDRGILLTWKIDKDEPLIFDKAVLDQVASIIIV